MKKILFAAMLLAAFVGCKNAEKNAAEVAETEAVETEAVVGDVVYVQVESVLAESDIFKSEGVALRDKTEKAQKSWASKEQKLQNEMIALQEKYQKGLITTRDAQQKEADLQKRAASYQESAQKEAKQLEEENVVFTNRMNDLLARAIADINADGRYKMIVNASALLDAADNLDITSAVLAKVNELYKADKEAK
ncbi:MAG: OmpH family outer membrane protein [Alistipes sp.]|nr:OmpH family outer membrane protein [Alistipes sp.]